MQLISMDALCEREGVCCRTGARYTKRPSQPPVNVGGVFRTGFILFRKLHKWRIRRRGPLLLREHFVYINRRELVSGRQSVRQSNIHELVPQNTTPANCFLVPSFCIAANDNAEGCLTPVS